VQQGFEKRRKLDKVAETLEIVFKHTLEHQNFKIQMKQLVRRVCVTGVGFVKIGYHRVMGNRPEDVEKITDITEQLRTLERLELDQRDGKFDENQAKAEQLRLLMKEIQEKVSEGETITDEGLVFDFPQSQNIIVDTRCRQLQGFIGAEWVAQEFLLTCNEVKEVYGVDLGKTYTRQEQQMTEPGMSEKTSDDLARIWEVYNKRDGMKYVIADGYPDFLLEPGCPDIKLRRFWPFFCLLFNEVENDRDIYPPSDIRLQPGAPAAARAPQRQPALVCDPDRHAVRG
jgi:predicted Rdx family selenoprotein